MLNAPAPLPLDPVRLEHLGQVRRAPRRGRGGVEGGDGGGNGLRAVIRRRGRRFLLAEGRIMLSLNHP